MHVAVLEWTMRVAAAKCVVEQHSDQQQAEGVERDRVQGEVITELGYLATRQHGGQGNRTAGWMQATQGEHRGNRQGTGQRGDRPAVPQPGGARDPHQR
ncbi:hypothetical protein D9M68_823170 [compost metagenome]